MMYRYRSFEISPSLVSYMKSTDWCFSHEDYDGAPDSKDDRCGHGASIEDCKAQIDDLWAEQEQSERDWQDQRGRLVNNDRRILRDAIKAERG